MAQLTIDLNQRSYPIHIGAGLLADTSLYAPAIAGRNVLIVTNDSIAPLYLPTVCEALTDYHVESMVLPDGEKHKTLAVLETIFDKLLQLRYDRSCTLIALGGGVIGDMTGFAAASYQRGVNFIQLPTTLLAQVDSSVGGKTGVNHPLGKNMIGAFHQPRAVIADTDTLNTLSDRQLRAGVAEVIKYGLLIDAPFDAWLREHLPAVLARDPSALSYAIERSCNVKAAIVAADEREKGQRALLNLGHTFGHAIETGMGYGRWLHGEAIAAGMCMAADLSHRIGWISAEERQACIDIIHQAGLPTKAPSDISEQQFIDLMAQDKKVRDHTLHLVLLKAIGHTLLTTDFSETQLRETIRSSYS